MNAMTTSQAHRKTQIPGPGPENIPTLPTAVKDAKATRELMFTLRHFHLGAPAAKEELEAAPDDALPALLDPFRDTSKLRYDYPLFLFPPGDGDGYQDADDLEQPLAEWLAKTVGGLAPEADAARILKDHLHWLEHHLRGSAKDRPRPAPYCAVPGSTCSAIWVWIRRTAIACRKTWTSCRAPRATDRSWAMAVIRPCTC